MSAVIAIGSVIVGLIGYVAYTSETRLSSYVEQGLKLQKDQPGHHRDAETRFVFLFWKSSGSSKEDIETALNEEVTPALAAKYPRFTYYFDDPGNTTPLSAPPALFPLAPPVSGMISFGPTGDVGKEEVVQEVKGVFTAKCFERVEGYVVEESVYTDYGEYAGPARSGFEPKQKRRWKKGERTPYPVVLTMFPMRSKLKQNPQVFKKKWFGVQSPMSEIMQPRIRYVRRFVQERLTENAPEYDAMVTETWPSNRHMQNPFYFFDASNPLDLVVNVVVMLKSGLRIFPLSQLAQIPCGEYICDDE